jgi:hypothetical protein
MHLGIHLETSKVTPPGGSASYTILSMGDTATAQDADARARKLVSRGVGKDFGSVLGVIGGFGGFVQVASNSGRGGDGEDRRYLVPCTAISNRTTASSGDTARLRSNRSSPPKTERPTPAPARTLPENRLPVPPA